MRYTLLVLVVFAVSFGMYGMEDPCSPYKSLEDCLPDGSESWRKASDASEEDGNEVSFALRAPHIELSTLQVQESNAGSFVNRWYSSVTYWNEQDPQLVSSRGQHYHLMTDHQRTAVWHVGKKWTWPKLFSIPQRKDAPIYAELFDPDGNSLPSAKVTSLASDTGDTTRVVAREDGCIYVWHNGKTQKPSEILDKVRQDCAARKTESFASEAPQVKVALSEYAHTLVAADFFGMIFVWKRKHNNFDLAFTHRVGHHIENIATDGKYAVVATSDNQLGLVNITCGHDAKNHRFKSLDGRVKHLMLQRKSLNPQSYPQLAWVLADGSRGGPEEINDADWLYEQDAFGRALDT